MKEFKGTAIIEIKESPKMTSGACPTIYEFEDVEGNGYYFRFRHDNLTFYKNDECELSELIEGKLGGGLISFEECCLKLYAVKNIIINDIKVKEDRYGEKYISWLNSEYIEDLLQSIGDDNE